MIAQVQIKQVYGVDTIYPANDNAKLLAQIAGTKTLKKETIEIARKLGFTFEVTQPTLEV